MRALPSLQAERAERAERAVERLELGLRLAMELEPREQLRGAKGEWEWERGQRRAGQLQKWGAELQGMLPERHRAGCAVDAEPRRG